MKFSQNGLAYPVSVFWITSATIYHRVNPEEPEPISYYDREEYNDGKSS